MRCLLVDKIIAYEPGVRIVGMKNVTLSERFLADHFPGFPVMPGVLQVEAVLQLASWLAAADSGFTRMLRLESVQAIKFREFIVPGDQMRLTVDVNDRDDAGMVCRATVHVQDGLKTELRRIRLVYEPLAEREDPDAARAHFDFISGRAPMGMYTPRTPQPL